MLHRWKLKNDLYYLDVFRYHNNSSRYVLRLRRDYRQYGLETCPKVSLNKATLSMSNISATTTAGSTTSSRGPIDFQQRNTCRYYYLKWTYGMNRINQLPPLYRDKEMYFQKHFSSNLSVCIRSFTTSNKHSNDTEGIKDTTENIPQTGVSIKITNDEGIDQSSTSNNNNRKVEMLSPMSILKTTTTTTGTSSTEMKKHWIEQFIPLSYRPYAYLARLDKPIGTMLLFWPCAWSIGLASTPHLTSGTGSESILDHVSTSIYVTSLFGIGAIVMRGAGCTINDLWDQKYDQHVSRTKDRPLVNGSVTPKQAIQFVVLQSSVGLCVLLSLQPHVLDCIYWGCLSVPLVIVYPTMKRFFRYPQLILGMTFNWGAILGWVAVHGSSNIDWSIVGPLYGSGITWTLIYDTLYAHQDKKDDAKLQLHSTALSFGANDDRQRIILHGLATITWLQWLAVGYTAFDTYTAFIPYHCLGVTLAYSHLIWQIQTADFDNPDNLAQRFRSNNTTGAIVAGAIGSALAAQMFS